MFILRFGLGPLLASLLLGGVAWAQSPAGPQSGPPFRIVAAENFYADVAEQIAGPHATVTSILRNSDQDPHLFEASPSVARALFAARIVVYNGLGYDPWVAKLLGAGSGQPRVILVADLLHKPEGANPHLWYDPAAMPAYAEALTADLVAADPAHAAEYNGGRQRFLGSLRPLQAKIAELRRKYAGAPVTATEPVFGYMAAALGLEMRNERFQLAVMNNTEPSAADVAAFETDLRQRKVRALIYNSQATNTAAKRLLRLAVAARLPVVGVTETEPNGRTYQSWMLGQLDDLDRALSSSAGVSQPR